MIPLPGNDKGENTHRQSINNWLWKILLSREFNKNKRFIFGSVRNLSPYNNICDKSKSNTLNGLS